MHTSVISPHLNEVETWASADRHSRQHGRKSWLWIAVDG